MLEKNDDDSVTPKILEFNFNADCSRVAEIYPNFYEEVLNAAYCGNLDGLDLINFDKIDA
jgi:hypothetical protein